MNMSDTDYWGLTQTPLTQNTHRCTCVCRLRRVFSWSHADYAEDAEIFYQQNLDANLDTNSQNTHTQACASHPDGTREFTMRPISVISVISV